MLFTGSASEEEVYSGIISVCSMDNGYNHKLIV